MITCFANTIAAVGENGRVLTGTVKYHFRHQVVIADITTHDDSFRFIVPPGSEHYDTFYYEALDHADNAPDNSCRCWTDCLTPAEYDRMASMSDVVDLFNHAIEAAQYSDNGIIEKQSFAFDMYIRWNEYAELLHDLQEAACYFIVEDIERAAFVSFADKALELFKTIRLTA